MTAYQLLLTLDLGGTPLPLVMAGWSCVPLGDDADPFGVDPQQTELLN